MRRFVRTIALFVPAALLAACAADGTAPSTPLTGGTPSREDAPKGVAERAELEELRVDEAAPLAAGFDRTQAAIDFSRRHAAVDFAHLRTHKGADGLTHVRLQQMHEGVKVFGADVVVHVDENAVTSMSGTLQRDLAPLPTAKIGGPEALAAAKADGLAGRTLPTEREATELVVWTDKAGQHLAWHTTFFHEKEGALEPHLWNHVVDAETGEVLARWNDIRHLSQASGPGGNAKYNHPWTNALDVEASGSSYKAETTRLRTLNMRNGTSGGTVVTGSLASFSDAAIDDAHGYAEVTLNMMSEWMGYNSIDERGYRIVSRVHYDRSYENAFWDGTQMTYGDGASLFHPLSGAIDVVAHEINHGFTSFHSDLAYSGQPGGLNESFSDIAGVTAAFYDNPSHASFDLGADIFKPAGEALRYMCNPPQDGRSIDNASRMTSSLDPHYSSGVMNKAFCLAAKRFSNAGSTSGSATQDGVKRAAKAFYLANANYWTSSTSFLQGCQGVRDAATALGYTTAEVGYLTSSWSDVGVNCGGTTPPPSSGCDETLTADSGTITSQNYPSNYTNNHAKTWCIVPATPGTVTLSFTNFSTESGYDFVEVLNAAGSRISRTSGSTRPASASSSKLTVKFTTDESVVRTGFRATYTVAR